MKGRGIRRGRADGDALVCSTPLSFLGGVDVQTGKIRDPECDAKGRSVRGKMLCFPFGRGSTVGSYAMYQLRLNGKAPKGIINSSAEPIVATGAIMSDIPMVDRIDISVIADGDRVMVDGGEGTVELCGVDEHHVVTGILRHRGKILLLQRSDDVGSYRGRWAGVSGYIESGEEDIDAVRREIEEEVGLTDLRLVRRTDPQSFRHGKIVWTVHPFLFDAPSETVSTDWEHVGCAWIAPDELTGYDTVPGLEIVVEKLLRRPIP
jgi:predicted aconitase with swiveling domain/8-oxo-dGTP pyrophosphatase MutT (NUDIX family)